MHSTLSFNGLLAGYPELFDDLKVPDSVSKDTVCNQLLFDTLELEVLYADGPTMRKALGVYSETMLPSWTRYAEALGLEYDALASDDRTRTTDHAGTSGGTINRTNGVKGTTTRAPNLTTTGQNTGSDSTTRDVTGSTAGHCKPRKRVQRPLELETPLPAAARTRPPPIRPPPITTHPNCTTATKIP